MTPFLYQTRTLAPLHWSRSTSAIVQPRLRNPARSRNYDAARLAILSGREKATARRAEALAKETEKENQNKQQPQSFFRALQAEMEPEVNTSPRRAEMARHPETFREDRNKDSRTQDRHVPKPSMMTGRDVEASSTETPRFSIRRTTNMHGIESPLPDGWNEMSADEPQGTGLIRRTYKAPEGPRWQSKRHTPESGRRSDSGLGESYNIDFEDGGDNFYEEIDAIDQLGRKSEPLDERTSTITPAEKHAFQKIFSDVFSRMQQAKTTSAETSIATDEDEMINLTARNTKNMPLQKSQKLHDIMGRVMKQQDQSAEEKRTIVNRYPAVLRAAAARAIGLNMEEASLFEEALSQEETDMHNRLEDLRRPERHRVESLMQGAKTDFELWEIMEGEVFPLISRLGLGDLVKEKLISPQRPGESTQITTMNAAPTSESLQAQLSNPEVFQPTEDGISPLALYGPLYPSHLLLGLRLLDRSFSKPSPLALSLLPKIKSHGLISHVLGASTQFYNELIRISWYRQDDFRGAEALLEEMEQAGLDFDAGTLEVVKEIYTIQMAVARGNKGQHLKALWSLPEFAPRRFHPWKDRIERALAARAKVA